MQTHLVPFFFAALLAVSGCQVDPPECTALLRCCAGLREPSASQCRDAYQVFRGGEHAGLLCREASQAYRCVINTDAGAFSYDAGFFADVGAPRYDAGRNETDSGPEFYPDAGPSLDVGAPRYDAGRNETDSGPEFYPDAGPSLDVGAPRYDAGRNETDAGPEF